MQKQARPHARKTHALTHERLLEVLEYHPETGHFTWRKDKARALAGTVAGSVNVRFGYRHIRLDSKTFPAGRLAWFYVHGKWPHPEIDHVDHCRSNDAIANLREATRAENCRYRRPLNGSKGVDLHRGKFRARIAVDGKSIGLGRFDNIEDAQAAYSRAAAVYHGQFAQYPIGAPP